MCRFRLFFKTMRIMAILVVAGSGNRVSAQPASPGYDRPGTRPYQSRSVVMARHGMVATSQPLAAQAGLEILKQGGNAADAAIATNAMLSVVEPMSCGIGGDLFVLYWDAKQQKLFGLNASGRSPLAINRQVFEERQLSQIPESGPLCWSVPGCVDGWEELRERFGSRSLGEILQPAIRTAEEGYPVSDVISTYWQSAAPQLSQDAGSAATFLPEGHAPAAGEVFRNPRLAETYRLLATEGRDAFYQGSIAHAIVEFSKSQQGFFSLQDFEQYHSEWVEPVSTNYRGYDVWELPPNGQGIAALQMLNILEGYDLASLSPDDPEYLHLFIEAKKLAFADRAKFYADPAMADVPVTELISKKYADQLRQRIDPRRAARDVPAGDPQLVHGDTVYLCAVDDQGNCCSMIQSLYYGFGSKRTVPDLGFPLQNRGALFSLDPEHANTLEPGKRPFHTIIPAMVTREGHPWLVFGVMGGDMQPQGHVQILVDLIDFHMNVQQAGDTARVRHLGSATPTGLPMHPSGGEVTLESRMPEGTVRALEAKGHVITRAPGGFGGYQAILIDPETGVLQGATEPRTDGAAVGY